MPNPIFVLRSSAASHPKWRKVGGGRRAAQISDILATHGIGTYNIDDFPTPHSGRLKLLKAALRLRFVKPVIKFRADRDIIRHLASDYLRHQWFFAAHPEVRILLIENCTDYAQIRAARDANISIVAIPANLEIWQNPQQIDFYSGESMPASLHREAVFAALSDAVFCISREEQWFLANYGANTDCLPYHPTQQDQIPLMAIRARRMSDPPTSRDLLAVTTVSNLKNRDALIALADLVRDLPPDQVFRLNIGGHGTEALRERFSSDRLIFHGELSETALTDLMARCHAAVVFQPSGVGALTRVPELLLAGVPVVANPHAARTWYGLEGLYLFHNSNELLELTRRKLPLPPAPIPDTAAAARFAAVLQKFAANRS